MPCRFRMRQVLWVPAPHRNVSPSSGVIVVELAGTVIYVDDVPSIVDFYQRAFGIESRFLDLDVDLPGRDPELTYQFADLTTRGGPLQIATHALGALLLPGYQRPPNGQPAGVEIAFFTDNVPAAFERAVAAGATIAAPPRVMPWGQTVAYVRSLEGTFVGLCTPVPTAE